MTAEAQRIAIAELCGFGKGRHDGFFEHRGKLMAYRGHPMSVASVVPDFLNDLNAVHEAEKILQDKCKYWPDYIDELSKLFRCGFPNEDSTNWSQMCHATAAQRAESLLRAVGKWIDEPK